MFYFVVLALVTVPLLIIGLLLVIGLFFPEVRTKGLHQLSQPFRLPDKGLTSAYELQKWHRALEDEVIRRFGQPDETTQPHD